MLRNYFIVALRSISRFRLYAGLNIVGLAVGLACFIAICLFVEFELSYDRFHADAERIHRVVQRQPGNVYLGTDHFAVTPAPLGETSVRDIPEVTASTTLTSQRSLILRGDRAFPEQGLRADPTFFELLTFRLLDGRADQVLVEPNSIVLTEALAAKLFPDGGAVGSSIEIEGEGAFTVTGVAANPPAASHLTFSFVTSLASYARYQEALAEGWGNNSWFTYILLQADANPGDVSEKIDAMVNRRRAEAGGESKAEFYLQPLTDIHLRSSINFEISPNGSMRYVYLFGAIGIVILLLACINYTNLAVARSLKRAREVGMRKTVGARRWQIVGQFLAESVLLSGFALLLAIAIVYVALPEVSSLVDRPLEGGFLEHPWLMPSLIALVLVVGMIAGSYPAFLMSRLRPVDVLKGRLTASGLGRTTIQRILVGAQFAASIGLVLASIVIYQQLQYVRNADTGFQREHILTVPMPDREAVRKAEVFRQELAADPSVLGTTISSHLPMNVTSSTTIPLPGGSGDEMIQLYYTSIGYDFFDVYEIPIIEGRAPSRDIPSDTANGYLINRTAMQALGWTTATGKVLEGDRRIIGVVEDFHLHSFHQPIQPLIMEADPEAAWYVSMRVRDVEAAVTAAEKAFAKITRYPFNYEFLDDAYADLYRSELRLGALLGWLTGLALLIASLGLFGLAAFAAEERTREIGIRKVLGASIGQIVMLLGKEFTILVGIAGLVALPVAYLVMDRWLEDFAYRIEPGPITLILGVLTALAAAWLSVMYQSVKAARANPAVSLRQE